MNRKTHQSATKMETLARNASTPLLKRTKSLLKPIPILK